MLVYVYKSSRKADTYLYVLKRDDFSPVPEALMTTFGHPNFVMILPLSKRDHLGVVDKQKLSNELNDKGFYLQLPPPTENLLKQHVQQQNDKHR
ncbi:YcgL domain-containing protein [Aliiglaciecola sp. LCG003]|uniref:YcgL domain-containing protein n=1 Tax=Aliiglaciecola sp. LCG003 TaxID=3053655 RepID=UPI002574072E|nr:YcgL domain-containing protein [Aliiglaciecola sp. LCG003]WJG08204.1 YcgL domain-containing protein [Aliiglaciecola sp. LCG003]